MISYIDTHTHLYLKEFDKDRDQVVQQALDAGVDRMLLPNVDEQTIQPMMDLHKRYPAHCLPMMGLHPTSVKPGYEHLLQKMEPWFEQRLAIAVGESGIDLYWDQTYKQPQIDSLRQHIKWALDFDLPLVIHSRNSVEEIMTVMDEYRGSGLRGVMHCFPGNVEQAQWFVDMGFVLGIGGVVTYKNSEMMKVARAIPLQHLILETDAPYLPPVPYRGKRNQSAYIPHVAQKIADLKNVEVAEVAQVTTCAAKNLFNLS